MMLLCLLGLYSAGGLCELIRQFLSKIFCHCYVQNNWLASRRVYKIHGNHWKGSSIGCPWSNYTKARQLSYRRWKLCNRHRYISIPFGLLGLTLGQHVIGEAHGERLGAVDAKLDRFWGSFVQPRHHIIEPFEVDRGSGGWGLLLDMQPRRALACSPNRIKAQDMSPVAGADTGGL